MAAKSAHSGRDKKFRLLFQQHPQPMLIFDSRTGSILQANSAAAQLYGYKAEGLQGLKLSEVMDQEEALKLATSPLGEQPGISVAKHRTKSGGMIDVEMALHDIRQEGERVTLAVLIDITARKLLEDQLRQAQKMEAVGMLAGGVAHDFNNLLTIISGYSQLMLNSLPPDDRNRYAAEQILKAGERAAGLTKQLLAFSRRQMLQPKVLDLNQLVTSLGGMLRRLIGEDVDLRLALRPDLGRVSADPGQIEQVLMNLVVNARDAMPKGGVLTVETRNVELNAGYTVRHVAVKPGRYVLLAVSDTGTGMDENTKSHLFEPFFTTKGAGRGTGLGLSTVFGIIKQSGGSVDVYSEPGRGTSIKVYLPCIDKPVSQESPGEKLAVRRGTETILLVEDDEMVRTLVRETLERDGYRVVDAAGPVEARQLAERHSGAIELLITDVVMPGVNGRDLAEQIVAMRPEIKVMFMSGYTEHAIVNNGLTDSHLAAFIQKPFTPIALTQKVREVLEESVSRANRATE